MKYPDRPSAHTKERSAIRVVENYLPDEWIVRELTERDYGVDLYVELVGKDGKVTGDLTALQIKGTEEIAFDDNDYYRFDGIKVSTFNYWCGLPVVVFLVVVDLKNKIPYWINVKAESRKIQVKSEQETMSFKLHREFCLDENGLNRFQLSYLSERRWPDVAKAILDSLALFNTLGPLYLYCRRKEQNTISSSTIQFLLLRHYENFCLMARYLSFRKPIPLPEWYDKHIEFVKKNNHELTITFHYSTIMEMFRYFISEYLDLIEHAYKVVTVHEKDYWSTLNPYIVLQLLERPFAYIMDDWYARYYYDEYENETKDIGQCFLEDLKIY